MSVEVKGPDELDAAFVAAIKRGAGALVVPTFPLTFAYPARIAELAAKHRLPAVAGFREFVDSGGLMAYGANHRDLYRRAAVYVARILGGANPAEVPVEQAVKYDLIINLRTAKTLGLTIPQSLLLRAEVLQ